MKKREPSFYSVAGWVCLALAVALNVLGSVQGNKIISYFGAGLGVVSAYMFVRHVTRP